MAKRARHRKDPSGKRRRGRPKGSTTRGETVAVGLRLSKALFDKIEAVRRGAEELTSRTLAMEKLLQEAIRAREEKSYKSSSSSKSSSKSSSSSSKSSSSGKRR